MALAQQGLRYSPRPLNPNASKELPTLRNRRRHRIAAVLAASAAAALGIAACGGDEGGDEDPQELLEATFSNQQEVTSGRFDLSLDVTAEGGDDEGDLTASLGGPFQSEEGAFPQFDLDAELDLDSASQDFSGEAGLTSAGGSGFVSFQGTDYEVPQDAFDEFSQIYAQLQQQTGSEDQGGNLLSSLGIDPTGWLTDLSNEGDEEVEGTDTIKITGKADVPALVEDLRKIAKQAPKAVGDLSPDELGELDQLTDLIEDAEFSFYTGADDNLLRKVEASVGLNPPETEDSPDSLSFGFSLTLSELNDAQEISAPADAQPLQGLLDAFGVQLPGGGGGGGGDGGGGGGQGAALPEAGGAPAEPSGESTAAYLECLAQAQGSEATQKCAELLE